MNKFTNFLTALIGGAKCTEKEVQEGFNAIKAAAIRCVYSNTQADGKLDCGRSKGTDYWGKPYLKGTGYVLTPTYRTSIGDDSKDAGEMNLFSIGRMDDRELFETVQRGRYEIEIVAVFLALAGVVIADNEIYSQEAIPAIIERINVPKVQDVVEPEPVSTIEPVIDTESLKAARKAAKQAEKAAAIAARKGR
jgi:hypothetical protein